jgi:hypothetical protein
VSFEALEEVGIDGEGVLLGGLLLEGLDIHHLGDRALGKGALSLELLEDMLCAFLGFGGSKGAVAFGEELCEFFFGEEGFALVECDLDGAAIAGEGIKAEVTEGAIAPDAEALIAADADDGACGDLVGCIADGDKGGEEVRDMGFFGALEEVALLFP